MEGTSLDITRDLIQKLKEIMPGAFTEDKINIEQLKQHLGDSISTDAERYQLSWAGKNDAYKVLQAQTTATLIPISQLGFYKEPVHRGRKSGGSQGAPEILLRPGKNDFDRPAL